MAKNKKRQKRSLGDIVLLLLIFVCAVGFVGSASVVGYNMYQDKKAASAFDELKSTMGTGGEAPTAEERVNGYAELKAQNADFNGWLVIPGTGVDYPVMYTPSEPEFYLRRAFDTSYSVAGTPFIGEGCNSNSRSWIIYGHEMDDNSMFGSLAEYESQDYWQAHPTIYYYTESEERRYQVIAAIKTRILGASEEGFRYYGTVGDITEEEFSALTNWVNQNALYDTGIYPVYGNQILMLSTCSKHTQDGRFVVVAQRIQ